MQLIILYGEDCNIVEFLPEGTTEQLETVLTQVYAFCPLGGLYYLVESENDQSLLTKNEEKHTLLVPWKTMKEQRVRDESIIKVVIQDTWELTIHAFIDIRKVYQSIYLKLSPSEFSSTEKVKSHLVHQIFSSTSQIDMDYLILYKPIFSLSGPTLLQPLATSPIEDENYEIFESKKSLIKDYHVYHGDSIYLFYSYLAGGHGFPRDYSLRGSAYTLQSVKAETKNNLSSTVYDCENEPNEGKDDNEEGSNNTEDYTDYTQYNDMISSACPKGIAGYTKQQTNKVRRYYESYTYGNNVGPESEDDEDEDEGRQCFRRERKSRVTFGNLVTPKPVANNTLVVPEDLENEKKNTPTVLQERDSYFPEIVIENELGEETQEGSFINNDTIKSSDSKEHISEKDKEPFKRDGENLQDCKNIDNIEQSSCESDDYVKVSKSSSSINDDEKDGEAQSKKYISNSNLANVKGLDFTKSALEVKDIPVEEDIHEEISSVIQKMSSNNTTSTTQSPNLVFSSSSAFSATKNKNTERTVAKPTETVKTCSAPLRSNPSEVCVHKANNSLYASNIQDFISDLSVIRNDSSHSAKGELQDSEDALMLLPPQPSLLDNGGEILQLPADPIFRCHLPTSFLVLSMKNLQVSSEEEITHVSSLISEREKELDVMKKKLKANEDILDENEIEIASKLSEIGPPLENAKQAVKNAKQELLVIGSVGTPPQILRDIIFAIFKLFGIEDCSWLNLKKYLQNPGVTEELLNYKIDRLKPEVRCVVQSFINRNPESFNEINVARVCSTAGGALVAWIKANLRYSLILEEIDALEKDSDNIVTTIFDLQVQVKSCEDEIQKLQNQCCRLKREITGRSKTASQAATQYPNMEDLPFYFELSQLNSRNTKKRFEPQDCSYQFYKDKKSGSCFLTFRPSVRLEIGELYQVRIIKKQDPSPSLVSGSLLCQLIFIAET